MQAELDFDSQDYNPPEPPDRTKHRPGSDPKKGDEDSGIIAVYRDRLAAGCHWRHPKDPPIDHARSRVARQLLKRYDNGEDNLGGYVAHNVVDEPDEETRVEFVDVRAYRDVVVRFKRNFALGQIQKARRNGRRCVEPRPVEIRESLSSHHEAVSA